MSDCPCVPDSSVVSGLALTNRHEFAMALRGRVAHRVPRGGAWNNDNTNCRAANRNRNDPTNANNNIGFRLCSALHQCLPESAGFTDPSSADHRS